MVKIICKRAIPRPRFLRLFCHSNPDRLAEISASARDASSEELSCYANEFSAILHDICVSGCWRRTQSGRLPCTERAILRFLYHSIGAGKPRTSPLRILDLGASDGITTLDLLRAIQLKYKDSFEIYLADLTLFLHRFRRGPVVEYRSSRGTPVMLRIGRLGVRLPESEHRWNWLSTALAQWYLNKHRFRESMSCDLEISLVNPLSARLSSIKTVEMDCLQCNRTLAGIIDIVRASNVLSPDSPDGLPI